MTLVPLLFLVIIALWNERVYSLECFNCNSTQYVGCMKFRNCSDRERFCTKYTASTISGFRIMQSCATACPIAKKVWPTLYTFICCQTDRCNRASRTGSDRTLLGMATFVSATRALAILGF